MLSFVLSSEFKSKHIFYSTHWFLRDSSYVKALLMLLNMFFLSVSLSNQVYFYHLCRDIRALAYRFDWTVKALLSQTNTEQITSICFRMTKYFPLSLVASHTWHFLIMCINPVMKYLLSLPMWAVFVTRWKKVLWGKIKQAGMSSSLCASFWPQEGRNLHSQTEGMKERLEPFKVSGEHTHTHK